MVICLERGADFHMAHLMPLPLTVSCFSKIHIGFTFLVPAHPGSPGKGPLNRVCVCVCVRACVRVCTVAVTLGFFTSTGRVDWTDAWLCVGDSVVERSQGGAGSHVVCRQSNDSSSRPAV